MHIWKGLRIGHSSWFCAQMSRLDILHNFRLTRSSWDQLLPCHLPFPLSLVECRWRPEVTEVHRSQYEEGEEVHNRAKVTAEGGCAAHLWGDIIIINIRRYLTCLTNLRSGEITLIFYCLHRMYFSVFLYAMSKISLTWFDIRLHIYWGEEIVWSNLPGALSRGLSACDWAF